MLTTLRIEHFAIVKQLELDFKQGMAAFTGETGAGKSIMIDALMLALGGRADASVIRPGAEKCDITAGFYFEASSEPAQWLAEHDIPFEEGEIFLRRIIYSEGRSKSYINGQPFPQQKIKELSEKLVHIHGQHQHQTLMSHATHREQLDRFANHELLLDKVKTAFKQCQQIQQEISKLENQEQPADRIKLLEFQIDELEALNLQEGEVEQLHQEHQLLHHAKEYLECGQQASHLLNGDDQENICSGLNHVIQILHQLPQDHPSIKNCNELINSALIQCEESIDELRQFADKIQLDPQRLQEVESRMSAIHQLARKYHLDGHQLINHQHNLQMELESLQNAESQLAHLQLKLAKIHKEYDVLAQELRKSRQVHAPKLAQEITQSIQQLGMPKGWIELELTPLDKMQAHGYDKVEYKVCTNPGMVPDSLSKIASGGELSRISLAIQMITAQKGATPTLLFDEVDVGIGGSTAALVGQMLRKLGDRLQLFCVTHQAQVAAAAHHHFKVEKKSDQSQTYTTITCLEPNDKINEIARMLGGLTITEQTLSHARELIEQSHY